MKTTWSIKRIGDVCEIRTGANQKAVESSDGKYPIYGSGGPMGFAKEYRCPAQTVLIGRKGTLNNPILVQTPCWNIDTAYGLISKEMLLPAYLFYFCRNTDFTTLDPDSGRPSTKSTSIAKIQIPLPPLSEQERIVGILDAAFEKIDKLQRNAERNLANVKVLFQQVLDEKMKPREDWKIATFKDLFDVRDGTHDSPKYHSHGHPLITSKNLKTGVLDYNNVKLISEEDFIKINERSKVDRLDLLFAMIGTIGNPIVVENEPDFAIKNVALFKNSKNQNMFFLKYLLNSSMVHNRMIKDAQGSNQKFVGLAYLRNFQTPYPPLQAQDTIVKELDLVSNYCTKLSHFYRRQIEECAELKQQVLIQVFNGEL